jgi:hypothetical protein
MLRNPTSKNTKQFIKKQSLKHDKGSNVHEQLYDSFNKNLDFLKRLNKILSKALIDYQKFNFTKEDIQKLDINELLELKEIRAALMTLSQQEASKRSIKIKSKKVSRLVINKFINALQASMINEFIREMSLVYIITVFEQYLSDVLKFTLKVKPEIMKSSKKQITYEELFSFKDFDKIKEKIAEREINSIISQDIENVNSNLKKRFNLNLSNNQYWSKFKEYFYRRHIIIHNNGCPDEKYRTKTGYKGKQKKLSITKHYLSTGIKLFEDYSKTIHGFFLKNFVSHI